MPSPELDAMKLQMANTKATMLAAMTLIDRLLAAPAVPQIDPVEVAIATADLKTVSDALERKVAAHTAPATPPPAVA